MTRYARGNKGIQKRPHEATSWADLNSQDSDQQQRTESNKNGTTIAKRTKKRKQKGKQEDKHGSVKEKHRSVSEMTPEMTPEVTSEHKQEEDSGNILPSLSESLASWREESKEDAKETLEMDGKKNRGREERRLKRIKNKAKKMVCYHCREAGHGVADCPKMLHDEEQGTGICFRCGSTEHEANRCTAKVDPTKGDFPFAKCFICQEAGHLARSCPDNPRGLYPLGGGCKHCGSVEHRNQHCPHGTDAQKQNDDTTLPTLSSSLNFSADAEIDEIKSRPVISRQTAKKIPKVVKF